MKHKNMKERIQEDEIVLINLLDIILFDVLKKDSATSKALEYCEKEFIKELRKYTKVVLKNYKNLTELNKTNKQQFNLEVENLAHSLTQKLDYLRDCAVETGACICMILFKTLSNNPFE